MKLNEAGLRDRSQWEQKGYALPEFDRQTIIKNTREAPFWIHFGAGNIFRAFPAKIVQDLLNNGVLNRGLIVAEGFDYEIIQKINAPHDNYNILATLKSNGKIEKTVIGSVVESLMADSRNESDFLRLKQIFSSDSLQMASFTITEKGYNLVKGNGELLEDVANDLERGPGKPESYIGKIAALLYTRFQESGRPIAMVSMDNCSHNGDKLYEAINRLASEWLEREWVEKPFLDYISNPKMVSFPWSMIDKITPRPDRSVELILKDDAVEGVESIVTSKNTYVAPFVNAEESEYLVIEDLFPNGRAALEKGGIIFTDRETVDKVEKMKVCTCLNPLHTALAVFGCLLGYDLISKEMQDKTLRRLVEQIGYIEGLPVVVNPGILNPKNFIDTVLQVRIPNPFMPDTPQRIATDTSQKLAIRFGETIKAYQESENLDIGDLKIIPLVLAGWLRYLMGVDDAGNAFELSPDPLLDTLQPCIAKIKPGAKNDMELLLHPILADEGIFGVSLYEVHLAKQVCRLLEEMIVGPGSVRETLERYVNIND